MKPTIGRIVIYKPQLADPPHNFADFLHAIIVRVWPDDTCVNLKVINDEAVDYWVTSSLLDEEPGDQQPGRWRWPVLYKEISMTLRRTP